MRSTSPHLLEYSKTTDRVARIMFLRLVKRARTCHGSVPLRGERCPVCGQAGQAAIDTLGVITLVVLILGTLMLATTQVAANVEAQLLCAVDSIGTEGGEAGCGEPADEKGPEGAEGIVIPPGVGGLQLYQVTTENGQVHKMELAVDNPVDRSMKPAEQPRSMEAGEEEDTACLAVNAEIKAVDDPLIEIGASRPSPW